MAACLFPPYFVTGSVGFGHGRLVRSLASLAAASSDEKMLRLIVLRSNLESNLAKFVNLTHRDPHLENAKFDFKEFLNFMSEKLSSRKFELSL